MEPNSPLEALLNKKLMEAKNIHVNPCRIKEGDHGESPHSISDGHDHVLEHLATRC